MRRLGARSHQWRVYASFQSLPFFFSYLVTLVSSLDGVVDPYSSTLCNTLPLSFHPFLLGGRGYIHVLCSYSCFLRSFHLHALL